MVVSAAERPDMHRSAVLSTKSYDQKAAGLDPDGVRAHYDARFSRWNETRKGVAQVPFQWEVPFFQALASLAASPKTWSDNRLLLRGLLCIYCNEPATMDPNGSHSCQRVLDSMARAAGIPVARFSPTTRTKSRKHGLYCHKYLYPRDLLEHPFLGEKRQRANLGQQVLLNDQDAEGLDVDKLFDEEWARQCFHYGSRASPPQSSRKSSREDS